MPEETKTQEELTNAAIEKVVNATLDKRNEPLPSPRWDEKTRKILGY
jgi:hypothetical protein